METEINTGLEKMKATGLEANSEETGHSGATGISYRRDRNGSYRSTRGPTWGPTTDRGISERTETADQRRCCTQISSRTDLQEETSSIAEGQRPIVGYRNARKLRIKGDVVLRTPKGRNFKKRRRA
jgi:hypothetical protein